MIRNIWAVGRNYADHAKELGNDVPKEPFIFLKAGSCAIFSEEINLPEWTEDVHHEIEIALRFDRNLNIDAYALALDLTERKKQKELKDKGLPWSLAKSFTGSCPLSAPILIKNIDELKNLKIQLRINSVLKQDGNSNQMIFDFETLIAFVKKHFPVCEGDWLLTGTPSGVGPLKKGDNLEASLEVSLENKTTMSWIVR